MISQQLIQQWEEYGLSTNQDCATPCNAYIQGRTDQYLQMQAEIERLKELLEEVVRHKALEDAIRWGNDVEKIREHSENIWQHFKTEHKL